MIRYCMIGVFVFVTCATTWADSPELNRSIAALENWSAKLGYGDLIEAIDSIRSHGRPGDRTMTDRLLAIAQNEDLPDPVRSDTMKVACELADAAAARRIVALGTTWVREMVQGPESDQQEARRGRGLLVDVILTDGIPRFQTLFTASQDQENALAFLSATVNGFGSVGPAGNQALEMILRSPTSIESRQAAAFSFIESQPRRRAIRQPLLDLLDDTFIPKLRRLVRESPDMEQFHWAALSALSHLGDREIMPDIDSWQERYKRERPNAKMGFEYFIWRIEVQHPRTKLLEFIRSGEDIEHGAKREWAIGRVVQLEIPAEDIREAILAHAQYHKPDRYGYQFVMARLKHIALELGILRPHDLADVRAPKLEVTPAG